MTIGRHSYDVVVVGAGPGGSVAALVLARYGVRVALVDKNSFPRDKACGDLVGPRGVALLAKLGVAVEGVVPLGDMVVIGPTGGRVLLPAVSGRTYPGEAWSIPRKRFDEVLYRAALDAGAEPITARVNAVERHNGVALCHLSSGDRLTAGTVIGADGATSTIASGADLLRNDRLHWGFAVRTYLRAEVKLPLISVFDEEPGKAFPGYGWLFPSADGVANVGVGVGVGADRRGGNRATRQLNGFIEHLRVLGHIPSDAVAGPVIGGWLKMGMLGTRPSANSLMLVGDAAGLVNPLQGEGISQAMESGAMAATAIATGGPHAALLYNEWLRNNHSAFQGSTAALQGFLLGHPRSLSRIVRLMTSSPVGKRVAPGWALYWNDLVGGAAPSNALVAARVAKGVIRGATVASIARRDLAQSLHVRPG